MALKLMHITNDPKIAKIIELAGVDRIFVDMEYIGKSDRQGGMDTVQSHHTVQDVANIRKVLTKAELLVRVNPIHEVTAEYASSAQEIDAVIAAGADVVMLPYFKTAGEVQKFIQSVNGRAKTMVLLETPEAAEIVDEILELKGLDEIYVGLNDLSLGCKKKFMFELLTDGTVEHLCNKFRRTGIPYGFGGVAAPGTGTLPAERIIREHYRLGSTCVILSRSFCNTAKIHDLQEIDRVFRTGIQAIRAVEAECQKHIDYFSDNAHEVQTAVEKIVSSMQ